MNTMNKELIEGLTVEQVVEVYDAAERDIRAGFAMVDSALTRVRNVTGAPGVHLTSRRGGHRDDTDFDKPDFYLKELRRDVWRILIARMEVRRAMSIAAWNKLEAEISGEEPPPITAENIEGMVAEFRSRIPEMLQEAIKEVFEWLRPRCSDYKTNSEFEIGKAVILSYMVECESYMSNWAVNYSYDQNLIALENVFHLVQGKPAPEGNGWSKLAQEIRRIPTDQPCHGATELFEFRGYKNRNLHIKFRRPDLVAKLNAIAGGNRLKPDPKAARTAPSAVAKAEAKLRALAEEFQHGARSVPAQFFPTPDALAARMVDEADVEEGHRVLEPSAGSGSILRALRDRFRGKAVEVVAVEVDPELAAGLEDDRLADSVAGGFDFMRTSVAALGGPFDRVVMNPPFSGGAAMAHVWRALEMLAPGGRLVAICPDGPREREVLRPVVEARGGQWEPLPDGSFEESGTGVRTVMIVVDARRG